MSEMKHTPGPWWVEESGIRDRGGYICHTRPAQRYPDQEERFIKETVERAANKTLIAAAPELLEALQGILSCVSVRIDDPRIEKFDAARAAIAKATGGQP